jgi:citrate lyase beta subunit
MIDPTFLDEFLAGDDDQRAERYPGPVTGRQPVHTVYVPADRAGDDVVVDQWRAAALMSLSEFGPLPGIGDDVAERVLAKLGTEPIEDLRIDFEDGYGRRPDAEEDAAARAAARVLAAARTPFSGIRIKSLEGPTRARGIRTLDILLDALGEPPPGSRITLPKVTSVRQVEAMVLLLDRLGSNIPFEIQIETPQAILGADGVALVAPMLHAAAGRCAGLHYGTYDYSASLGVAAAYQSMEHPVADHAKAIMQVAAAGTGVPVCDGSTNVLPVGSTDQVHAAWLLHARLVNRSLERGFYQGWDLHPAQLPTRFAATFTFYRDGVDAAASRLRDYLDKSTSGILDEPATARALAGFLLRGLHCGALDAAELPWDATTLVALCR